MTQPKNVQSVLTRRKLLFPSTRRPLIAVTPKRLHSDSESDQEEADMHADPSPNYDVGTREARDRLANSPAMGNARAKAKLLQPHDPEEAYGPTVGALNAESPKIAFSKIFKK